MLKNYSGHFHREKADISFAILWTFYSALDTGRKCAKSTLEIIFEPSRLEFVCQKPGTHEVRRFAAKGLTKTDLMGELTPFVRLPVYQLALPFSLEARRKMELARILGGTIL